MPMQTIRSALARSFAAAASMAASCSSSIDEGRCTQPRKSLPAPSPEWSRALAACVRAFVSSVRATPDAAMSSFSIFISIRLIWLSAPSSAAWPKLRGRGCRIPCRRSASPPSWRTLMWRMQSAAKYPSATIVISLKALFTVQPWPMSSPRRRLRLCTE